MPRSGQILLQYNHPHFEEFINDNTEFQETTAPAPEGVKMLYVFTSGKGRDGVLLPFKTAPDYLEEYGNPNYKLYGQPGYMPWASLRTTYADCSCMRVMPDDATYSNIVIVAKAKVDTTVPATPKLVLKFEAVFHSGLDDKNEFAALTDALQTADPDTDGFITYPIIGGYVLGRGVYGDTFRLRMTSALEADKDNGYKNYRLELLDAEGGITRKEYFDGTLYSEAIQGTTSLYITDKVDDSDTGSDKIGVYVVDASLEAIFNLYKTTVDPTTTLTLGTFDLFTGKTLAGTAISNITIDAASEGAISLDIVEGLAFSGGDDGSFKVNPAAPEVRETAINNAYIKAFSGGYDKAILSKRRVPIEIFLDANFPDEVKREFITLSVKRGDGLLYVDGGLLNTQTDAIAWAESMTGLADRIFSKDCSQFTVKDPFSGKNIAMTMTYYYASKLPIHYKLNGKHIPFTGKDYSLLTGHVKNSLKPLIDADDLETKETLYNSRVNYYECIAENTFIRGTQSTAQSIWSDLSEEHNMAVLLEMKRKLEGIVASLTYNFAEKEDRLRFTDTAERALADYRTSKVRDLKVYFDMNAFEEERSILHCYLATTFRTISKKGIIEIDINKRV